MATVSNNAFESMSEVIKWRDISIHTQLYTHARMMCVCGCVV